MTVESASTNRTSVSHPFPLRLRNQLRRGSRKKKKKEPEIRKDQRAVLSFAQNRTAAVMTVVAWASSIQSPFELGEEGAHEPPPLVKELVTVDGLWEKESQFSLKVQHLVDNTVQWMRPHPHEYEGNTDVLNGLREKKRTGNWERWWVGSQSERSKEEELG